MSKKRRRSTASASSVSNPANAATTASLETEFTASSESAMDSASQSLQEPKTLYYVVASLLIFGHFAALVVALGSNLYKSRLQGEIMSFLAPYQVTTSQTYGGQPLELTHAEDFDFPLVVQVRYQDAETWESLDADVFQLANQSISRWPTLARAFQIIASENAESEMLGEIAFRFVRLSESQSTESSNTKSAIEAIRFLRPIVPSYDEYSASTPELQELVGLKPETVYEAQVVRDEDRSIGVIPAQEAYRSAKPAEDSATGDNTDDSQASKERSL